MSLVVCPSGKSCLQQASLLFCTLVETLVPTEVFVDLKRMLTRRGSAVCGSQQYLNTNSGPGGM